MEQKRYNSRFVFKGDTEENWNKAIGFIPLARECIVYEVDETHSLPRLKIGDGVTAVQELPFVANEEPLKQYMEQKFAEAEAARQQLQDNVANLELDLSNVKQTIQQSDYMQSNENAIDYIKNRPCYDYYEYEPIFYNGSDITGDLQLFLTGELKGKALGFLPITAYPDLQVCYVKVSDAVLSNEQMLNSHVYWSTEEVIQEKDKVTINGYTQNTGWISNEHLYEFMEGLQFDYPFPFIIIVRNQDEIVSDSFEASLDTVYNGAKVAVTGTVNVSSNSAQPGVYMCAGVRGEVTSSLGLNKTVDSSIIHTDTKLYKIMTKTLDDKFIPDTIARIEDISAINFATVDDILAIFNKED